MEPTREQFHLRRIAELENENAELRRQNAALREQNARLTDRVSELTAQVATLTEQNAALHDQVANLIEQVAALSRNSSNSSKPPSSDIVKPPKPNNTNAGVPVTHNLTPLPLRLRARLLRSQRAKAEQGLRMVEQRRGVPVT